MKIYCRDGMVISKDITNKEVNNLLMRQLNTDEWQLSDAYYVGIPGRQKPLGAEMSDNDSLKATIGKLSSGMTEPYSFVVADGSGWCDKNGDSDRHFHIAVAEMALIPTDKKEAFLRLAKSCNVTKRNA